MNVESEAVGLRIDFVRLSWVFQLLQDFARPDAPAFALDGDVRRWVVVGLEKIRGVEVSREVRRDKLLVLAAGLRNVSS